MPVEMTGKTCPGGLTEVQPNIITLGAEDPIKNSNHPPDRFQGLRQVGTGEFAERALMNGGRHKDMTVVVRIPIQEQSGMRTPPGEQVITIVRWLGGDTSAKKTTLVGRRGLGRRFLDVLGSPGCPESVHEHIPPKVAVHDRNDREVIPPDFASLDNPGRSSVGKNLITIS